MQQRVLVRNRPMNILPIHETCTQELGKMFEAQCTPEFYYFNNLIKLKYRGRLDSDGKNSSMGKPELYYAIEETISKGYCSTRQYPSIGCSIKWKN